ncbi:MAG: hypothetical protein NXI04_22690 [Planctomycetaceae bacterium]|nr:hypothetical protein [Planctomycetaceae bacterium]
MRSLRWLLPVVIISCRAATAAASSDAPPVEMLLQKYCLGCHNENDRETGLSLQTPESLKRGSENGPVVDPADLKNSLLYQVLSTEVDNTMPPDGEPQPSAAERDALRQWVLSGAKIRSMAAGKPDVPPIRPFGTTPPRVFCVDVSADGQTIATGGSGQVQLKSMDGRPIWSQTVDGRVTDVQFADRQPWLLLAAGRPGVSGSAQLRLVSDGSLVRRFDGHTDALYAAVLSADATLVATAGYDRRILIHDAATGKILRTLEGHNGSIFSLAFDPTGRVLCSASADGTVKVWQVSTGQRLDTLSQPQAEQYSVCMNNDGRRIYAAGADNRIRVWRLKSTDGPQINPQLVSRFAHEQSISRLTASRDGQLLASCAEDGTVSIWDAWPLEHRQTVDRQQLPVTGLAFVGQQQLLITLIDGTTHRVAVTPAAMKAPDTTTPSAAPAGSPGKALAELTKVAESENNNTAESAQKVPLPVTVSGVIAPDGGDDRDVDCFQFSALAGQPLLLEVKAARNKSPLDSRIEVLTTDGQPVLRTRLQAVRDSYFTFRGKDSSTSGDFRVFNWQEMELNEYLYSDGEVVKLWLYPRGPDSGFNVYPGFGKRWTYFGTTPTAHALQAPCFIVRPRSPAEELTANGLPVFDIYYENDDDPRRELGSDSRLHFTAATDGDYVVRLTDARGFSGPDHRYELTIRSPQPGFRVRASTSKLSLQPGTGREVVFTATRIDGYDGPINIDVVNLPPGFAFSGPVQIQPEQLRAFGTVYATTAASQPAADAVKQIQFVATADSFDEQKIGGLEELKLLDKPKLKVHIGKDLTAASSQEQGVKLTIRPGETISAMVALERISHKGVVSFGKEDSGRNLPHGLYVDNIGLNGLLLLAGQSEREFFITAAPWVPPSTSTFYLKSSVDGVTSFPVSIEVLEK